MTPQTPQPPASVPADETLDAWIRREAQVRDALTDGHPNPEGYMEWWYAKNPKPKSTGGTP